MEANQVKEEQEGTAFQARGNITCKGPGAGKVRVVGAIGRRSDDWRTKNKGKQGEGGRRVRGEQTLTLQSMSLKGNGDPPKTHEQGHNNNP